MPTEAEDRKIRRAARADPDAQPLTDEQLEAMVPIKAVRGRQKSENKKLLVSVRYSPEVLSYFRSTDEGWQSRMDGVFRECMWPSNVPAARNALTRLLQGLPPLSRARPAW